MLFKHLPRSRFSSTSPCRSAAIDSQSETSASMFRRNYESILVFPGFSTGTKSARHRAVNAPLHPAEKEPQRVRHLAVLLTSVRKNRRQWRNQVCRHGEFFKSTFFFLPSFASSSHKLLKSTTTTIPNS